MKEKMTYNFSFRISEELKNKIEFLQNTKCINISKVLRNFLIDYLSKQS